MSALTEFRDCPSAIRLYTRYDLTQLASINNDVIQTWLRKGLISASYHANGRPLFAEEEKRRVVQFAKEYRASSPMRHKIASRKKIKWWHFQKRLQEWFIARRGTK